MPIVVITVLGGVLRFVGLGHQGFWYDEAYTSFLLRYSPGHMLGLLPHLESTPPLYYCVAWVWVRVFGNDPAGLKSLSAVCGTAAIPVAYAAAQRLLANRRSALIAAGLIACNPLLIWYSQEARAYSMLVLTSALTVMTFATAREHPRPRALAAWALACALALTTHYYGALVVVPEAAWLLYEHRRIRAVQVALAAVVIVALALVPLLIDQNRTGNDDWIVVNPLLRRLGQVIPLFLLGPGTHLRTLVKYLAYAGALVGLVGFGWSWRRGERPRGLLPGGLALAGFLIAATVGETTLLTRNLLPIVIPLALFLAAGLGAPRVGLTGLTAATVLCAVGVFAAISVASDSELERPNWQPLAQALGPWPAATRGARLLIVQDNPGLLPLGLYMKGLRYVKSSTLSNVTAIDLIAVKGFRGEGTFCWWGSACNLTPSHLDRRFRPRGFRVVRRFGVEQFRVIEMVAATPHRISVASLPTADRKERANFIRSGRGKLADGYLLQTG